MEKREFCRNSGEPIQKPLKKRLPEGRRRLVDISKLGLKNKMKKFSYSFIRGKGYSPPSGENSFLSATSPKGSHRTALFRNLTADAVFADDGEGRVLAAQAELLAGGKGERLAHRGQIRNQIGRLHVVIHIG